VSRFLLTRLATIVLLCAAGVSVAGCAGGNSAPSMSDYTASVITTRNEVDGVLARATRAQSKEEFLQRMDEAAVVIDDAATQLDKRGAAEGFEDATSSRSISPLSPMTPGSPGARPCSSAARA
jgi:hypothetical protein